MPARTLNDFLAGFFYGQIETLRGRIQDKTTGEKSSEGRKAEGKIILKQSKLSGKGTKNRR
jgi:hypothetical protein